MRILLLSILGAFGTLARYWLQGWLQSYAGLGFPAGTLGINLIGCFLLGAVGQLALEHLWISPEWRIAVTIGFLGAFTTFSTFGWETVRMLEEREWANAILYVGASVIGGLIAVIIGMKVAERF